MSFLQRLQNLSGRDASALIAVVAFLTIAGAWIFEAMGFAPCELCLKQRFAYYAGVPLAALLALLWPQLPLRVARMGLTLLALIFIASMIFGMYHAGVEWGFWPGPADCTGTNMPSVSSMNDFMKQLQTTRVVRCDEVALRIFGLSLAGWHAVISAAMAGLAFAGSRQAIA